MHDRRDCILNTLVTIDIRLDSIDGRVEANTCYCKRGSQFASQVAIAALVVDSSNQYAADVNAIPRFIPVLSGTVIDAESRAFALMFPI